jgi:signal peptidase I
MSKSKKMPTPRGGYPKLPAKPAPAATSAPPATHAVRETIESIVIAFVLAFLFRTFEAEAFVIPTGSMAPTLMGAHKDVDCLKCGHRFQVNSSEETGDETPRISADSCFAGMCPNCRYVNPFRPGLPIDVDPGRVETQKVYNGDRILVNKYIYTVNDPQRWDVVVFKFPGNAQINYIKRLVGLPGETIRLFQGDLFAASDKEPGDADFKIARKPENVLLAMRQLVHDTNYDPVELFNAQWPLRWQPQDENNSWKVEAEAEDDSLVVNERYSVDATGDDTAWLRYRHFVPSYENWRHVDAFTLAAKNGPLSMPPVGGEARPQLITDFNAYNTRVPEEAVRANRNLAVASINLGLHWVGDLMVEADVEVEEAKGELIVDLVEAGKHFSATIDLATGRVVLGIDGVADFAPAAETTIKSPGKYRVALSNFDDELRLWVDGSPVKFDKSTEYDVDNVFGGRDKIIPKTSDTDPGDLAPVGIGARGTKLAVTRLQVWRDIYYIADSWKRNANDVVTDFRHPFVLNQEVLQLPFDPTMWERFRERNQVDFPLGEDQFFVMGDNSPASSDARLWLNGDPRTGGTPGGAYLERQMLIGKALCVYWPHSWNRVPGTPIPFPLFPNFEDMRLVR